MGRHQGDVDPGERGRAAQHQDQARHWQGLQVNQPIRELDPGERGGTACSSQGSGTPLAGPAGKPTNQRCEYWREGWDCSSLH